MRFIIGKDRKQAALFPVSFEESIWIENEVRAIGLFVDSLDLGSWVLGVLSRRWKTGLSPFRITQIVHLGLFDRIRSSRILEKECESRKKSEAEPLHSGKHFFAWVPRSDLPSRFVYAGTGWNFI